MEDKLNEIKENYLKPGHEISFSTPQRIFKHYNKEVPLKNIKDLLASFDGYTLHKEYKKPKYRNPFYVYYKRQQMQADLIDMRQLASRNDDVTFLLCIIDSFTRYLWVIPLKNKSQDETCNGFKKVFDNIPGRMPKVLLTDSGKEFLNHTVLSYLKSKNITHKLALGSEHKAGIVERVQKSLQILIFKYLSHFEKVRYIDQLQGFVTTYNTRKHRSLPNLSPIQAEIPKNQILVRSKQMEHFKKILSKKTKKPLKFQKGDIVRIKSYSSSAISTSKRAYNPQFNAELFEIIKVNTRMPIAMFVLKSMDTEEKITGSFYGNELVKVKTNDIYKIEKVIKSKGKGANKQYLVKWKDFGDQWNSWVPAKDVDNI